MANPTILSVYPDVNATDIILNTVIKITFDQLINTDTLNNATLALIAPNASTIVTPDQIIDSIPDPVPGIGYLVGSFTFETISSRTVATFSPSLPLLPGAVYTVIVIGLDSPSASVVDSYVTNQSAEPMLNTYQWSFTTGTLDITTPPTQNPTNVSSTLNPDSVQISPRVSVGGDISVIELTFPAPIDTNSLNVNDILVAIEPILNDPDVMVPPGASASATIQGNKVIIHISGI